MQKHRTCDAVLEGQFSKWLVCLSQSASGQRSPQHLETQPIRSSGYRRQRKQGDESREAARRRGGEAVIEGLPSCALAPPPPGGCCFSACIHVALDTHMQQPQEQRSHVHEHFEASPAAFPASSFISLPPQQQQPSRIPPSRSLAGACPAWPIGREPTSPILSACLVSLLALAHESCGALFPVNRPPLPHIHSLSFELRFSVAVITTADLQTSAQGTASAQLLNSASPSDPFYSGSGGDWRSERKRNTSKTF
jgi:hypothetical protein